MMRWMLIAALACSGLCAGEKPAAVEILFTQEAESPQARIVAELGKATRTITIQEYQLVADPIINALLAAQKRGVKVVCVLDHSLGYPLHPGPKALHEAGAEVVFDCAHAIAHNKLAVIDGELALGGSYNWSEGAEKHNAENLDVFRDVVIIKRIVDEIAKHKAHCRSYDEMLKYVAEQEKKK